MTPIHKCAEEIVAVISEASNDRERLMVGVAGPPGAGKSTLAAQIVELLNAHDNDQAVLVPMDGYHFDNVILLERDQLLRKGAPETFDKQGLLADLKRASEPHAEVAVPVFDRLEELSRAGARLIKAEHRVVVVEGNYLLLKRPVWQEITELFDLKVWIFADEAELKRRLSERWASLGYQSAEIASKVNENDLANAKLIIAESSNADLSFKSL